MCHLVSMIYYRGKFYTTHELNSHDKIRKSYKKLINNTEYKEIEWRYANQDFKRKSFPILEVRAWNGIVESDYQADIIKHMLWERYNSLDNMVSVLCIEWLRKGKWPKEGMKLFSHVSFNEDARVEFSRWLFFEIAKKKKFLDAYFDIASDENVNSDELCRKLRYDQSVPYYYQDITFGLNKKYVTTMDHIVPNVLLYLSRLPISEKIIASKFLEILDKYKEIAKEEKCSI